MAIYYRTEGVNDHGGNGTSRIKNGLEVRVSSPLTNDSAPPDFEPSDDEKTNPEQLLALAWATCLNATAQAILSGKRRSRARVTVELRDAASGSGYEFHVDAYLSIHGVSRSEGERVLEAAHARCPVSKLLHRAPTVRVHLEHYT